jgi:Fe-S cluster biogenesis protein NfuA
MARPVRRLGDREIGQRIARVDELLERIHGVPGPTADAAVEAVRALTEVYGEALARVADQVDLTGTGGLLDDELLGHLLALHDLHPEPVERRAARAVERLRPALRERGGDAELVGIDGTVATVRLTAGGGCGCSSSSSSVEDAVREAVLALAPELTGVRPMPEDRPDTAFVPLDALTRRPARAGEPA